MKHTKKDKRTALEKEIDSVIDCMSKYQKDSKEYSAMLANLKSLMTLKAEESAKKKVSPDTVAIVAGNLLGIVLILTYEKANIITTKALGFIIKGRV